MPEKSDVCLGVDPVTRAVLSGVHHISDAELARASGWSLNSISAYRRGVRRPSVQAIQDIAMAGGMRLVVVNDAQKEQAA